MEDVFARFFDNLVDRLNGPMKFRLVLQPAMAVILGVRGGIRDSRGGKPPYFWALFTDLGHRAEMLKDGWKSIGRVFVFGIVMDVIYQLIVFRWVYPMEALFIALLLALVPYLLIRGPVNRVAQAVSK